MYNSPFYMPGYNPMLNPNMLRNIATNGLINGTRGINTINNITNGTRTTGLLSRLGTGLSSIRKINWGGLINNTSKTLGIINQTIPLVRQVGPMVNNMRSMLRIASVFKDETDIPRNINLKPVSNNNNQNNYFTDKQETTKTQSQTNEREQIYSESPTFFINT